MVCRQRASLHHCHVIAVRIPHVLTSKRPGYTAGFFLIFQHVRVGKVCPLLGSSPLPSVAAPSGHAVVEIGSLGGRFGHKP